MKHKSLKHKNFLKNILTTTSTLALLVGATEVSAAAQLSSISMDPARTSNTAHFTPNFVSGYSITLGMGSNLIVDSVTTIGGIVLDAFAPGTLTVASNATIGSIANVRAGESFTVPVGISDGETLTLNGTTTVTGFGLSETGVNNYDALGALRIGSIASATATTLNINSPFFWF